MVCFAVQIIKKNGFAGSVLAEPYFGLVGRRVR